MDRFELFTAMMTRKPITVLGHSMLVNGIQMEDGSGFSFIVTGQWVGHSSVITIYIRFEAGSAKLMKIVKRS